jgi:hypothetical protein
VYKTFFFDWQSINQLSLEKMETDSAGCEIVIVGDQCRTFQVMAAGFCFMLLCDVNEMAVKSLYPSQ